MSEDEGIMVTLIDRCALRGGIAEIGVRIGTRDQRITETTAIGNLMLVFRTMEGKAKWSRHVDPAEILRPWVENSYLLAAGVT